MPETRRKVDIKSPGENRFMFVSLGIVGAVLVSYVGLIFYQNSLKDQLASIDTQILVIEQQRDKEVEDNLIVLNKQINVVAGLLGDHIFWSEGFSKIEGALLNQVQVKTLNTKTVNNEISIVALTTNYTLLARQVASFLAHDFIKDVKLNSVKVITDGTLEFQMDIVFAKNKFLK